ncbi:MAG: ketopantoate reductase C-terminal domain-containing protein [Rikenellaceae bacterium]
MNNCSSKKIRCTVVGRGAVGAVYCAALSKCGGVELSVAAPLDKVQKYASQCFTFNGEPIGELRYTCPTKGDTPSDFILLTTKWSGYRDALEMIRPLVGENTIILPLLNGLLPYELAVECYGAERVRRGYYVGCTATRSGSDVTMGGFYETVIEGCSMVVGLFDMAGVSYRVAEDMERSRWLKFIINLGYNHTTALNGGVSYGELKRSGELLELCRGLMSEGAAVAQLSGVSNAEGLVEEAMSLLPKLLDSDYGSMAQDIRSGRVTEREILGDDLLRRAQRLAVELPLFTKVLSKD